MLHPFELFVAAADLHVELREVLALVHVVGDGLALDLAQIALDVLGILPQVAVADGLGDQLHTSSQKSVP